MADKVIDFRNFGLHPLYWQLSSNLWWTKHLHILVTTVKSQILEHLFAFLFFVKVHHIFFSCM